MSSPWCEMTRHTHRCVWMKEEKEGEREIRRERREGGRDRDREKRERRERERREEREKRGEIHLGHTH